MSFNGTIALVTGANRGLGKAYVDALIDAGAAKVYAAARDPNSVADSRAVPIRLDVTSMQDVAAAAKTCADVNLLINNAGVLLPGALLAEESEARFRSEMEVNVFGVLRMARAFAAVLAQNGGGVLVNVLSVVSWFVAPFNPTYCASKHAALAVTDGLRIELKNQGTHVVGVHAGFIDTDMAANWTGPKTSSRQVAARTWEGIRRGDIMVLADARAEQAWQARYTSEMIECSSGNSVVR